LSHLERTVDLKLAIEHGLTQEEYERIVQILGGNPTYTELGIYSVMWSEHCSYKNSIALLKTLPRTGSKLLVGAGEENAGLVDIGDGLAVAFKIESHNHPSAVEPYQGAATGVGGIMRDIFTMGARPVAGLDSLRFGDLRDPRTRYLLNGVVRGIADYGNCFGVPMIAGEVYFDKSYKGNPLVNVMAVGIVKHNEIAKAVAEGEGNPVMIVGSRTGRDGIHGATFASEEISEKSEQKRPSVQVGDPFTEKLLLEATLEVIRAGYLVGIQDMGAAGITCSTSEMSARGKCGMEIDLDKVPVREKAMSAYEIMLSESQERMLIAAKRGYEEKVKEVFEKWDLNAVAVGTVTADGNLKVKHKGTTVACIPAETLVLGGSAPVYHRESREPEYIADLRRFSPYSVAEPERLDETVLSLLSSPNIASKRWIYEQYDTMVRTNSLGLPGGDAAIVWMKDMDKALSVKTDCNPRYVYLNPRRGTSIAVCEAARNIVSTGGRPVAITNCLNFGNPHNPEVFWQFKESVYGMGEACRFLDTPVTGGNVSFYNEDPNGVVFPTPVIGMIGLVEKLSDVTTSEFKREGDLIICLGTLLEKPEIGGSEYLSYIHGIVAGDAPDLVLSAEKRVHDACLEAIQVGIVQSAHDAAEGGIVVTIAESCIQGDKNAVGAQVVFPDLGIRKDLLLFSENQSRVVISVREEDLRYLEEITVKHKTPMKVIGRVGGKELRINNWLEIDVLEMRKTYFETLRNLMDADIAA
jgi:phosphoribosylformylglycinamidine synthase